LIGLVSNGFDIRWVRYQMGSVSDTVVRYLTGSVSVIDTAKLLSLVKDMFTGVTDIGQEFLSCVVDTGEKLLIGINDTGSPYFASVIDTGEDQNYSKNVKNIRNRS
jgi:hypothetical protein